MSKSLFNKVAGLRPVNLLEKRIWRKCFPANFAKFLKTTFFIEHLRWLLLYIFYWYNWFFPHNHDCALVSIGKCNLDEFIIINSLHFTQEHCLRYFLFVWIIQISAFFKQLTLNFDGIQSWWIMIKPLVTHFVHLPDNDDIPFSVFRLRIFGIGNIKVWSIWTLIRSYFYVVFLGAYIEDLVCSIWN